MGSRESHIGFADVRFELVVHLVKRSCFFGAFIPVGSVSNSEQDLHRGPAALAGLGCAEALTEVWRLVSVPRFVVRHRFVSLDVASKLGDQGGGRALAHKKRGETSSPLPGSDLVDRCFLLRALRSLWAVLVWLRRLDIFLPSTGAPQSDVGPNCLQIALHVFVLKFQEVVENFVRGFEGCERFRIFKIDFTLCDLVVKRD
jgi:hypothetical protein